MTTETTNTGWLLVIASAICLLGALVIVWARSEWSEKQARKAEAIIVGPTELTVEYSTLANVVTVKSNEWRPDVDRDMHLGAVVEDDKALRWVRLHPGGEAWINQYERASMWSDIPAPARVLSEGVGGGGWG